MTHLKMVLTATEIDVLSNIRITTAMRVVAIDMLSNNDGEANRSDVWATINELVVRIDHLLKTPFKSKNQFAGLTTVWSTNQGWLECQSGRWTATPNNLELMRQHAERQLPNGIMVDDLMAILNKIKVERDRDQDLDEGVDQPAIVAKSEQIDDQSEVKPDDPIAAASEHNLESIILQQIKGGLEYVDRLKQILRDHYGSDV